MDQQMPSPNRLISGRKIFIAVIAFFVLLISFSCIMAMMTLRSAKREYTTFGKREAAIIKNDMGVTIDENVTPVRLVFTHGGADYAYQLWINDIKDPAEFMADFFDGDWELAESAPADLEEQLSYGENDSLEDAAIYECRFTVEDHEQFDRYYMAFYPSHGRYKAKIYGTKG